MHPLRVRRYTHQLSLGAGTIELKTIQPKSRQLGYFSAARGDGGCLTACQLTQGIVYKKNSLPWTVDHLSIMMPDMVDSFLALRFCSSLERCVAALASGPSCLFSSLWSKIPMGNSDMGIIFAQACFSCDVFFTRCFWSYVENLKNAKGQLISKWLFGVFNFFQKTNKNMSHSSKNEFVHSFFGRIRGYQKLLSKLTDL